MLGDAAFLQVMEYLLVFLRASQRNIKPIYLHFLRALSIL